MEKAIKKAIEGGWNMHERHFRDIPIEDFKRDLDFHIGYEPWSKMTRATFLIDPLFWQALGKTEGWDKDTPLTSFTPNYRWDREWHRFIEHLASGKDIDSFFGELLK